MLLGCGMQLGRNGFYISGYTEDEENAPDWDIDLGHNTKFCEKGENRI